jgi:hypothetical protein
VKLFFAVLVLAVTSAAQTAPPSSQQISMPSNAEIGELLSKADQKVAGFEEAVKLAKPHLDKINPRLSSNYLDASLTAHKLIETTQKNGTSAYRLVSLLATLDDLSLNAANASVLLLKGDEERLAKGKQPDVASLSSVIALSSAETAVNDISELLMHATLRFVEAEEQVLDKPLDEKNKS